MNLDALKERTGAFPDSQSGTDMVNQHYMYSATPAMIKTAKKGDYEVGNTMYGEVEAGFIIGELSLLARELR